MSKIRPGEVEPNLAGLPLLPPGWCWTTLATISEIVGGITKDQKRKRTATMREVPYLRVANVQRGYLELGEIKTILADTDEIESLRLRKGDILFTEGGDRDKLGRGWVWNDEIVDCIHQNHIFRARPNVSEVDAKFVSFHGNFFGQKWFTRTGKQTTNLASINKGVLSRFPVPLAPTKEQRRIVAKIEELFSNLDAGVAALKRAKANLKRYRAAVLKAAVEGKLTEEWRAEHPDTVPGSKLLERILTERQDKWEADQFAKFAAAGKEPPKNWQEKYIGADSPDITRLPSHDPPQNWCWVTLDAIAYVTKLAGFEYTKFVKYDPEGDLPVLKAENAGKEGFRYTDFSFVKSETVKHLERSHLQGGELLMVFVGGVGQVAIVPSDRPYFLGPNVGMIRVTSAFAIPRYCELFLRSPTGYSLALSFAKAVAQPSLSMGTIRQIPVLLPPIEEQRQVLMEAEERFSQISTSLQQIDADLVRAARMRQSILKRAFEGKLVTQDPTDEPASAVLERLRASRSAHICNGKPATPTRSRSRRAEAKQLQENAD